MAPRGMITVTTALLCFILGLLSQAPATSGSQMSKTCCMAYTRKPVPFQRIKGYREQRPWENCHMEAIIFYTVRDIEICATQKDEWVRRILKLLSSKLKKMSKTQSAAGKMKKRGNPAVTDGSGSFFNTTEPFLNNTESFY